MDIDHARYVLKEIASNISMPFEMANEELADDVFPYIKRAFPNAIMVKCGIEQYVVVNDRARNALIKQLEGRRKKLLEEVDQMESVISILKQK